MSAPEPRQGERLDDAGVDRAAELLAEGFAAHIGRWAHGRGASRASAAAVRQAALALSRATSDGQVCIGLDELAAADPGHGDAAALRRHLLASGLVGEPAAPGSLPLVLDTAGRLYLHRYFDYERRLARRLVSAAAIAPASIDPGTQQRLGELFARRPEGSAEHAGADWQMLAVALALRQRLVIVSGGPGTGKTTTLVALLACLVAAQPGARIALAAPTGKAAARMTEAIHQQAARLPAALRASLPNEASTIHRLLGVTGAPGGFVHHAGNHLAIDALVIDEASMLDLALATRLLEAVPGHARIVLLGDKDQLAAVESGAVFSELSADPGLSAPCREALAAACAIPAGRIEPAPPARPSPLRDAVVWFSRNYRFAASSGIGRLAKAINGRRAEAALAVLREGNDGSAEWLDDAGSVPAAATLARLLAGYAPYLDALHASPGDLAGLFVAFAGFRALCAVREGGRGVAALNDAMTRHVRRRGGPGGGAPAAHAQGSAEGSPWYAGRPVQVLRNDYLLRLFNGDVGIALAGAGGELMVHFQQADGSFRAVAPLRLPEHETAWAMTVHKAQGSEFDDVLVLLPARPGRAASRELLYTAVTRARRRVVVAAGASVLAAAIDSPARRPSGLLDRMAEAAGPPAMPVPPATGTQRDLFV